ncbi:MAG: DUF305 domain-containing protein [Thermoleophilaceae bacterium]|nr:DUF305 domain-containing protein [Thermoleophilaceae bacterium]
MIRSTVNASFRAKLALFMLVAVTVLSGCGNSEKVANQTDKAFVQAMIPHHQMAVAAGLDEFANGKDKKLRTYGQTIANVQMAEIGDLLKISKRIGAPVDAQYTLLPQTSKSGAVDHVMMDAVTTKAIAALGLTTSEAGMADHSMMGAGSADSRFVAMMIPHHEGAVRMAKVEIAKGGDADLIAIARSIVTNQTREIGELKTLEPQN